MSRVQYTSSSACGSVRSLCWGLPNRNCINWNYIDWGLAGDSATTGFTCSGAHYSTSCSHSLQFLEVAVLVVVYIHKLEL